MYSKIKIFGHPVHPILVAFPIAFYTATLVCYIVYNSNNNVFWFKVGYVANLAGIIMAVVAALPGFIDWLYIPARTAAKKTGLFHMICNVAALVLFALCFFMQKDKWDNPSTNIGSAIVLSALGFLITGVAGFLGFSLIQKHHVGVDPFSDEETKMVSVEYRSKGP
jgi:uncharacterized membrane protein